MLYTTFTVIPGLRCNTLSMKTNGFDREVRVGGEYILRSIIYSLPTHMCTSMQTYHQPESPSFCGKPATVHTSFIYPPRSTDGFVVVHLAVSTISGSRSAIGFHSVSLEIACGKKKKKMCRFHIGTVRFRKLAGSLRACSRKQVV